MDPTRMLSDEVDELALQTVCEYYHEYCMFRWILGRFHASQMYEHLEITETLMKQLKTEFDFI